MTRIRANRESIDDRFSVLGFTVNVDQPLFEIGLATDPDLFKPENRARRTAGNFFASPLQSARPRSDAVYLVPPAVVSRFVGQPRLYFGVAAYGEGDRSKPITVRRPDSGHMYVSLRGLTERGLRRSARGGTGGNGANYGTAVPAPTWGGDAVVDAPQPPAPQGGACGTTTPAPYSDGYPDELWRQSSPPAPAASGASQAVPSTVAPSTAPTTPPTTQGLRGRGGNGYAGSLAAPAQAASDSAYDDGFGPLPPARRRAAPTAREMRVVSSYYNPSDWLDALRTQLGFFASSVQWWAGVDNTTVMPHSAICQARTVDGSAEGGQHGTAFFIAPNLLLTAAHVVDGQSELIIVPGKNGAGTAAANEPFGRFRVSAADMVKHPSYVASSRDFDIALIRVPSANTSPNYFDLVEELTQSRPEGVVVSGYAAYSDPQGLIDSVVNATIDADRQHLHGGYIRSLPSDETFDYDLQSLGGTSGSPVYYIEAGDAPRMHMVGVHVAGHSDTTNLGCRITPAKLAWIRQQSAAWSQSLSFSLGARALSDDTGEDAEFADVDLYGHEAEPVEDELASEQSLRARAFTATAPDYPGASRFVPAHARNFHRGRRRGAVVDRIVIHITAGGPRIDGTISWFQDGERRDPRTGRQSGPSSAHYIVGRDGEVVQMVRNADTAYHASSANSRSIGIEHNANKPYRLNRRDLPPTMEQYQASAHLVAWLCGQYGIPLDREHIVGHIEATPGDNHDCPSSYWDWDTYMQCVQLAAQAQAQNSSTGAVPASSQGLRGPLSRAQEIITPYYDPSNPASALTCQNDAFSLAREEWFVGVDDTRAFPHSAICLLEMKDASGNVTGRGTGFYIGANRILTCAHNLHGQDSVDIVPGNNGRGVEPFGRCNAVPGQWRIAPGYTPGNYDRDLAVIENVAIAAPGGTWFSFLNATPSDRMPLVVCGYSSRSEAVPELTAAIDGYKQHLHGGYARQMPTPDTIDYPILTLKRASGSPVYTLRDAGNGLEALICAVHVSGVRADTQGLNTGCFLTPSKLDWIEGRTTSFAQREPAAARSRMAQPRPAVRAQELLTPYYDPSNPSTALQCTNDAFSQQREEWYVGVSDTSAFPHSAICYLEMNAPDGSTYTGTGFYIGPNRILTCAHNLHGMRSVTIIPGHNGAGSAPFGQATIDSSQWRVAPRYSGDGDWDNDMAVIDNAPIAAPNGAFFRFLNATPGENMPLAVCGYSGSSNRHPQLGDVADPDRQHLHGGHARAQATPETIDYDILAVAGASGSPVYAVRDSGNGLEALVCGVHVTRGPIEAGGGVRVNRGCFVTPAKIDWIEARATTFGYRGARALSAEPVQHRVTLVPQPDKNACWAASMAMLKSFRSDASFDPEAFVREAGGSLSTSYGWDQLERVRDRYGFRVIAQPSNASLYHAPAQWAQWLQEFGPLWVVIVGAPHAVVVGGIRGELSDPAATEVYVLNPWDTTTAFDNDPVAFNPPNRGHEGWMPFDAFAADFGNMAEPDYGNWRVLHLPASAAQAQAQSLGTRGYRLAAPPRPVGRALSDAAPEPIEPPRVPGTRMSTVRGSTGASRWALDQLEGRKAPASPVPTVSSLQGTEVVVDLGEWPALEGQPAPLPLTLRFATGADGSVGDVSIRAGTPAALGYGVDVTARIDDAPDADGVATLNVRIDVRFSGLAQGAPAACIELRLLGNGRYERSNRWTDTSLAA